MMLRFRLLMLGADTHMMVATSFGTLHTRRAGMTDLFSAEAYKASSSSVQHVFPVFGWVITVHEFDRWDCRQYEHVGPLPELPVSNAAAVWGSLFSGFLIAPWLALAAIVWSCACTSPSTCFIKMPKSNSSSPTLWLIKSCSSSGSLPRITGVNSVQQLLIWNWYCVHGTLPGHISARGPWYCEKMTLCQSLGGHPCVWPQFFVGSQSASPEFALLLHS